MGGPIGGSFKGSLSAYTRKTDGQFENSFLGCDDCVDYFEESGAIGRLVFDAGDSGEIDFKAKVSTIDSGAINFNASLALAEAAAFLGAPPFQEDANAHVFEYINNVKPVNEQDNLNLSIKGEWEVGGGSTLTAIAAYNDQDNFFLTDGTSAAFFLYSADRLLPGVERRACRGRPPCRRRSSTCPSGPSRARLASCHRTARRPATDTSTSSATSRTRASRSASPRRATSACAGWPASTTPTSTAASWCRRARDSAPATSSRRRFVPTGELESD